MFPVIDLGPFAIQAAGLILLLSFFIGSWLTSFFSSSLGTNGDAIENCLLLGLITGIIGARLGFMLQNTSFLLDNPLSLVSLTPSMFNPGFGILTGVIVALIIAQRNHLPLWPTLDSISPFILLLYTGIHLANFANGNNYGVITNLPWGIELWGAIRHPVQLYAVLLAMVITLWSLFQTKLLNSTGFQRSGELFCLITSLLGLSTLFTRAFVENKQLIGPLDFDQIIGFFTLLTCIIIIYLCGFQLKGLVPIIICLGSNIDAKENIRNAQEQMAKAFRVQASSSIYKSDPVKDGEKGTHYLNQVLEVRTEEAFPTLLEKLKVIEHLLHRQPKERKRVTLDLDIITYGSDVFSYQGHQIPDPDLIKFKYIAEPLAEMNPDFSHPANGQSIAQILENLTDDTQVTKLVEVENGSEE